MMDGMMAMISISVSVSITITTRLFRYTKTAIQTHPHPLKRTEKRTRGNGYVGWNVLCTTFKLIPL